MRNVFLLFLAGCGGGLSDDDFRAGFAEATCDLFFECAGDEGTQIFFETPEDCQALYALAWASIPDDCTYDPDAAQTCLDAMDGAACTDQEPQGYDACNEVYTGSEGCRFLTTST